VNDPDNIGGWLYEIMRTPTQPDWKQIKRGRKERVMPAQINVGDEVIVDCGNTIKREKVVKVGRKYLTVSHGESSIHDEFSIETGREKGHVRGFPKYLYTMEQWHRRQAFIELAKSLSHLKHQVDKWNIYACEYLTIEWLADAKAKIDEITEVIGGRAIKPTEGK
jgi:hypothetical protein